MMCIDEFEAQQARQAGLISESIEQLAEKRPSVREAALDRLVKLLRIGKNIFGQSKF